MAKKIVVACDLESVLLPEYWPVIASNLKVTEFQLTTRDLADLSQLMQVRLDAVKKNGLSLADFKRATSGVQPFEGAEEFVQYAQSQPGVLFVAISDAFFEFIEESASQLGIKNLVTNRFVLTDGQISGMDLSVIGRKDLVLEKYVEAGDVTVAIGDSFNDISMLEMSDIKILFNASEELVRQFPLAVSCRNLKDLQMTVQSIIEGVQRGSRILVADTIGLRGLGYLEKFFTVDMKSGVDRGYLEDALPNYDAIVVRSGTKLDRDLLEKAGRLKVIARAGIGVDNIDLEAATKKGILVINDVTSSVNTVAEHTMAMMLALSRNIVHAHNSVVEGRCERARFEGNELWGKKLAIIGFGRIGSEVAKRAVAFGMEIVAYDPFIDDQRFQRFGVKRARSLDEALMVADYVSLHTPAVGQILGEKEIAVMKHGAKLLNIARGGLVDEKALFRALAEKRISGAALDVFQKEPLDLNEFPVNALDNVIVTPHLGASTREARERIGYYIAVTLTQVLLGQEPPNILNKKGVRPLSIPSRID